MAKQPIKMFYGLSLLVITALQSCPALMIPVETNRDEVALVGHSAVLSCLGQKVSLIHHHPSPDRIHEYVYDNGNITDMYSKLGFRMAPNQHSSERKILIGNVTTDMVGKYECDNEDNDGKRSITTTPLIVLETLPECSANMDEFVGPNNCNIHPDEIVLSCTVRYLGNHPPKLEWRKSGESEVQPSNCTEENVGSLGSKRTRCNLTMRPDFQLNGLGFVCQTTEKASQEKYSCTTKPIVILHSFDSEELQRTTIHEGERIVCRANSSQSCTYKWTWYERVGDDESRTVESADSVLVAKKIGLHRCEAKCPLRNQTCLAFPKYVEVIPPKMYSSWMAVSPVLIVMEEETKRWSSTDVALLILGVLPCFAIGFYCLLRMVGRKASVGSRCPTVESNSQVELSSMHGGERCTTPGSQTEV